MEKNYYYQVMGQVFGPMTDVQLRDKAICGHVVPDTLVRIGNDGEWFLAERLTNVFDATGKLIANKSSPVQTAANVPVQTSDLTTQERKAEKLSVGNVGIWAIIGIIALIVVAAITSNKSASTYSPKNRTNPNSKHYTDPNYDPNKEITSDREFQKAMIQELIRHDAEQR